MSRRISTSPHRESREHPRRGANGSLPIGGQRAGHLPVTVHQVQQQRGEALDCIHLTGRRCRPGGRRSGRAYIDVWSWFGAPDPVLVGGAGGGAGGGVAGLAQGGGVLVQSLQGDGLVAGGGDLGEHRRGVGVDRVG